MGKGYIDMDMKLGIQTIFRKKVFSVDVTWFWFKRTICK